MEKQYRLPKKITSKRYYQIKNIYTIYTKQDKGNNSHAQKETKCIREINICLYTKLVKIFYYYQPAD